MAGRRVEPELETFARPSPQTENWERWARRHWREVMIYHGVCTHAWISGRPRLHAKVCLSLGHLRPADIRVELLPVAPLPDGHPLSAGRPMFSIGALPEGRYLFGVNARAEAADSEREWLVRICPSRTFVAQEIPTLVRLLDRVPAGTPRRRARA